MALAAPGAAGASLRSDLQTAVHSHRGALERCFDRELKRDDPATGTVMVSLVVAKNGRITRAKLAKASKRQRTVGVCLVSKIRRLRLPAQRTRAAVLLPIRLRVREG